MSSRTKKRSKRRAPRKPKLIYSPFGFAPPYVEPTPAPKPVKPRVQVIDAPDFDEDEYDEDAPDFDEDGFDVEPAEHFRTPTRDMPPLRERAGRGEGARPIDMRELDDITKDYIRRAIDLYEGVHSREDITNGIDDLSDYFDVDAHSMFEWYYGYSDDLEAA